MTSLAGSTLSFPPPLDGRPPDSRQACTDRHASCSGEHSRPASRHTAEQHTTNYQHSSDGEQRNSQAMAHGVLSGGEFSCALQLARGGLGSICHAVERGLDIHWHTRWFIER